LSVHRSATLAHRRPSTPLPSLARATMLFSWKTTRPTSAGSAVTRSGSSRAPSLSASSCSPGSGSSSWPCGPPASELALTAQRRRRPSDYGAVTGSTPQPRVAGELRQLSICGDTIAVYGEERRARVAVCIPVRNAEATLERCLDSVLAQERV